MQSPTSELETEKIKRIRISSNVRESPSVLDSEKKKTTKKKKVTRKNVSQRTMREFKDENALDEAEKPKSESSCRKE